MKTPFRLPILSAILAVPLLLSVASAATPANPAKVKLAFQEPDRFTDIDVRGTNDSSGRDLILDELTRHMAMLVKRTLPEGQTLSITFTDIDLAGALEPWRGPSFNDVRIVRETYPPRLKFTYQLLDGDGKVVSEGTEKLTDLTFMFRVKLPDHELTRYEKELLSDWVRRAFPKPPKAKD